jgi:DNA-binding NtrC family response regulator
MLVPACQSYLPTVVGSSSHIGPMRKPRAWQLVPASETASSVAAGDQRTCRQFDFGQFIGRSPVMMRAYARIRRAAAVDSTVLILGETGTGKEFVARALHQMGRRRNGPFVAVNCAAVPTALADSELFGHVRGAFTGAVDRRIGRFEQAHRGTLLLDEIGDLGLAVQAKLLRVLETFAVTPVGGAEVRKTDVRILAATSRDIHEMVREGSFRADLFYRLDVVTISLPPLRERPEDIPLLVEHFLQRIAIERRLLLRRVSPELMRRLIADCWPGNVRELRNALESMGVMAKGETLTVRDLIERLSLTRHGAVSERPWLDERRSVPC